MRNTFARTLTRLAESDPRIVLLSGDIGNRLFDNFKEDFPTRFYNCGVAEANMTGVAAGLALSGYHPLTYTIAPFATTRCLEQIRVDLCYHNVPAIIVGVGAGLSYAGLGPTHHSCEDIAFLRALPNMTVMCPGDPLEVERCLELAVTLDSPCYLRLGKKGEPKVHQIKPAFEVGEAICLQKGTQYAILSTGTLLPDAVAAAEELSSRGISGSLYSFPTVKPLDNETLDQVSRDCALIVTVEEHSCIGGFGSAVAEWLAARGKGPRLLQLGTPDQFLDYSGNQEAARQWVGLTSKQIVEAIVEAAQ